MKPMTATMSSVFLRPRWSAKGLVRSAPAKAPACIVETRFADKLAAYVLSLMCAGSFRPNWLLKGNYVSRGYVMI